LAVLSLRLPGSSSGYDRAPASSAPVLAGHPGYRHHLIYEDQETIAFLARNPIG